MDKNFIHIDEYMRQRLSGGEKPERPGAWLSMRELLDKEMPVVAAGYNWRRFVGYFTVLLLLSSATVGGYMYLNHVPQENAVFAGKAGSTTSSETPGNRNSSTNVALAPFADGNEKTKTIMVSESTVE